ncbi:MAG: hypothetical protein ABJA37_15465 [Ferruginibacter sp.]
MNIITSLSLSIVFTIVASCQPHQQDGQNASTSTKDTAMSQKKKPFESGYAELNGVKNVL